jgi:hypothetical protein
MKNHRPSVFVGTYRFYVRDQGGGPNVKLDDIVGGSLLEWLTQTIVGLDKPVEEKDQWMHMPESIHRDGNQLDGAILCGQAGLGERLFKSGSGEEGVEKTADQAGLVGYYFRIVIEPGAFVGTLILTRIRQAGPYRYFNEFLAKKFSEAFTMHHLYFVGFISHDYQQALKVSPVKELQFATRMKPTEVFNELFTKASADEYVTVNINFKAVRGKSLKLEGLDDVMSAAKKGETATMPSAWQKFGRSVKLILRTNGRNRTISLDAVDGLTPYEEIDLPADGFNARGWPTVEYMRKRTIRFLEAAGVQEAP